MKMPKPSPSSVPINASLAAMSAIVGSDSVPTSPTTGEMKMASTISTALRGKPVSSRPDRKGTTANTASSRGMASTIGVA